LVDRQLNFLLYYQALISNPKSKIENLIKPETAGANSLISCRGCNFNRLEFAQQNCDNDSIKNTPLKPWLS
jgi:hypothetical protein